MAIHEVTKPATPQQQRVDQLKSQLEMRHGEQLGWRGSINSNSASRNNVSN